MKRLGYAAIVTVILSSAHALALPEDGELIEVTAPDLSGSALPPSLGALTGWAGAASGAGAATLQQAALKAAAARIKKDKAQKKDQSTKYDDSKQESTGGAAVKEGGSILRQLWDSGQSSVVKYTKKNPDGSEEILEIRDCVPSGMLNPKNPPGCTEQKMETFIDPTDGQEKYAFSISFVEAAYNPKHYYADANGFYPKVIDEQSFTLVITSEADLLWQMQQLWRS